MSQDSSLLLVLFVLCVTSSNSISAKVIDVDVICKEASNQSYCSNLLNSKPGGAKANYYYRCSLDLLSNGGSVSTKVGDAQVDLYYKRYAAMAKESADIMKYILECIDSLHKHETSPLLAKYVENLRQGAQVFQIITKYLNLGK
ncbi:hypothetical protein MTR_6g015420 [Medicago truncatula]|uniref:Pectinesterase inhibitor domain-containing protein n=2 Tax=Medicago truncatula TaxID=3880 RepID=A0A072UGZ7_MEDTR|nr:hypothetical protein MTR_6g015420 [Medicago truncatula]